MTPPSPVQWSRFFAHGEKRREGAGVVPSARRGDPEADPPDEDK